MITESTLFKLKPCPASGEGVHTWLFHAACRFVEAGWSDEDAEPEIEALMTRDPNPPSEIMDALRPARGERRRSTPRWSPVNPKAIIEAVKNGLTLSELVSRSPEPISSARRAEQNSLLIRFSLAILCYALAKQVASSPRIHVRSFAAA
jgi:hypothetical protein